ncbi:MAG: hypothetical protein ACT4PE_05565 [Candidatus Eiseniibacteriota bacterium]
MATQRFSKAEVDSLLDRNPSMTAEDIFALEQRGMAGRLNEILGPPPAGEENVRARLLGTLPPVAGGVAGTAAGILTRSPQAAALAGGAGAAGGRMLENLGRETMGLPRRTGTIERMAEEGGAQLPDLLGRGLDVGEQALGSGVIEGLSAGAFGALPGRGTGAIAGGLARMGEKKKAEKAVENVARNRQLREAKRVPVSRLTEIAERARIERESAGADKDAIIGDAPGEVTFGEIVKRVQRSLASGPTRKAPERRQLQKRIRATLESVMDRASAGAVSGRQTVFNIREADWAKTAFDRAARRAHEQTAGGVGHDPDLAQLISNAFRDAVEERIPTVRDVNAAYNTARRADVGARRTLGRATDPSVQRLQAARDQAQDEAVRLATMTGNTEPLLNPTIGMGGQVWFHPPKLGTLLSRGGEILGNPAVTRTGRVTPELLNALLRLGEPELDPSLNRR